MLERHNKPWGCPSNHNSSNSLNINLNEAGPSNIIHSVEPVAVVVDEVANAEASRFTALNTVNAQHPLSGDGKHFWTLCQY